MGSVAADQEQALVAAHRKLLAAKDLQFDFTTFNPPETPAWLEAVLRALAAMFKAMAPALSYIFWGGLAVGVILIAWLIARDLLRTRRGDQATPAHLSGDEPAWRPTREKAQALLSDADALAAQGRYAEAAHLILIRSIDDFASRRPGAVKPALTSRDLAQAATMPDEARRTFAVIAQAVERSLFGGRAIDADGFAQCRRAYEDFALPERWA